MAGCPFQILECDPTRCSCFTTGAAREKLLFNGKTIPTSPHQNTAHVKKQQRKKQVAGFQNTNSIENHDEFAFRSIRDFEKTRVKVKHTQPDIFK